MAARKAPPAAVDTSSWDAFWAEVNTKDRPTETIRGVTVSVPNDLPLRFQQRINELRDSSRDEDLQELTAMIFGDGVLDQWIAAGMGIGEFQVVVAWGYANGSGRQVTFREAYEMVLAAEAEGKAGSAPQPNRAARRAATKSPSSATGTSSRRTSSGSTTSARKTSRA